MCVYEWIRFSSCIRFSALFQFFYYTITLIALLSPELSAECEREQEHDNETKTAEWGKMVSIYLHLIWPNEIKMHNILLWCFVFFGPWTCFIIVFHGLCRSGWRQRFRLVSSVEAAACHWLLVYIHRYIFSSISHLKCLKNASSICLFIHTTYYIWFHIWMDDVCCAQASGISLNEINK